MQWTLDSRPPAPAAPVALDEEQRRVVEHRSGPLLVLAGPGTGKTTTIVEAICARLEDSADPIAPDSVLALTFGRRAAVELRDRVAARLEGGVLPVVSTFHSFAYGLLKSTDSAEQYCEPLRLMSGAEEDARIRELLVGAVVDGRLDWPEELVGALPTLGLANEVRSVLVKARELGIEGDDLRRIGESAGRPAWTAIGRFAREEQEVMLLENVIDYAELLFRAWLRARQPQVAADLHRRYRAIYVDEYQDTDPLQVDLLKALVGPGCSIVVVGDPDQAIYGFRGADVGGLLNFPAEFRTASGGPAPIAVLRQARRFGPTIRTAAAAVFRARLPHGLPPERAQAHRSPICGDREPGADVVAVRSYDDPGAQAAHLALEVRAAHLERGVEWGNLAVLVRSGAQIHALQRSLMSAGVPVVVAADEIPLKSEPAVATLLAALRLVMSPGSSTAPEVLDVLTGPMVGLTTSDLRRLGRALRAKHHEAGYACPPSDQLIREFIVGVPERSPLDQDDPVTVAAGRLRILVSQAQKLITDGATPEAVLWTLWTGGTVPHGWSNRLHSAALAGSRSANHDLDAVMALFDAAERLSGRRGGPSGVGAFLAEVSAQQIPSEPVADRGTRSDAVRILTTHRAKGLEWDEVWVVGAQEGIWPDLRARGTTLRAEELTRDGIGGGPRPADLLEEERRLFYVACTRPRRRLHISVVEEPGDGGDRPSRFVADVLDGLRVAGAVVDAQHVSGRPPHPLTLDGLVAQLRGVAQDPQAGASLRDAALSRLAVLSAQRDEQGEPLVPLADPRNWWGIRSRTQGVRPVRDAENPIRLSGSGLDGVLSCSLKWFLEHEARAETMRGTATAFGSVVHAVADFVAKDVVPADLNLMDAEVDRIWSELRFEAAWQAQAERAEARAALSRFLVYHDRADRELVGAESGVSAVVNVPTVDGFEQVRLTGYIDRVERDSNGRLVPIDLKNMRFGVPDREIPEHGQLGVYQLMLREGGLTGTPEGNGEPVEVGGAALVQLRLPAAKGAADPKVQFQEALSQEWPTWVEVKLGAAARTLRTEDFTATAGHACRYCAFKTSCPAWPAGEPVTP